jgi:ATP-dependent protease HslVU (ClpYQ) peptidase subunit
MIHKDKVYIGADSAGIAGHQVTIRNDPKVFRKGPFVLGFAHSFRMGQLLRYRLELPDTFFSKDLYEYMVTDFIDAVRVCFAEGGHGMHGEAGEEFAGKFLVGINDQLFEIDSDFQVGIPHRGYAAIGAGQEFALGALAVSKERSASAKVGESLRVASEFSAAVAPPFVVLKTGKKAYKKDFISIEDMVR